MRGCILVFLAVAASLRAAPFPAEALTRPASWDEPSVRNGFRSRGANTPVAWKNWPDPAPMLGGRPVALRGRFVEGKIDCITLLFLDAGIHFGYVPQEDAAEVRAHGEEAFRKLHARVEVAVLGALADLAGGPPEEVLVGRTVRLRQKVKIFRLGEAFARFQSTPGQLVKVTLFRDRESAASWMDPAVSKMSPQGRVGARNAAWRNNPLGDHYLPDLPLMPQGDRAYCGVSALAMVLQDLGLNLDTEDLAAGAGIRFGSTAGSHIMETYFAAATEGGFKFVRADKLDMGRLSQAIDHGMPVLVWRRWSQERDFLHTQFARRLANDPTAQLPPADDDDRAAWPTDRKQNHASILTGFNAQRGEVIFTESWNESLRGRRMRFEEMAGTSYCVFYADWRGPEESLPEEKPENR